MLTYERYISDPAARQELEREVARLRRDALDHYLFEVPSALMRRLLHAFRARARPARMNADAKGGVRG